MNKHLFDSLYLVLQLLCVASLTSWAVMWLDTALHELAHALAARLVGRHVSVQIGRAVAHPWFKHHTLVRITSKLYLGLVPSVGYAWYTQSTKKEPAIRAYEELAIGAAGPLGSLIVLVLCVGFWWTSSLALGVSLGVAFGVLQNIRMLYCACEYKSGAPTDGKKIQRALRKLRSISSATAVPAQDQLISPSSSKGTV